MTETKSIFQLILLYRLVAAFSISIKVFIDSIAAVAHFPMNNICLPRRLRL